MALKHKADQYAHDVVKGVIPSNNWLLKSCQRYIDDLKNAKTNGWYFDVDEAQRYIDFIQEMPLTKGELAGTKLQLQPWQQFLVWNIYGWKLLKNGYRRFNKATISVPKKNGKTELIAAIAVAHLVLDDEFGAEIYMAATSRNQAKICFKAAQTMVQLTPDLNNSVLQPLKTGIYYPANNSSIAPISSEAGGIEGGGTSLAVYDEEHEQKETSLKDNIMTGQAGKPQGLFISISTSGVDKNRPYYDHIKDCYKVLSGTIKEENHFILIFGVDEIDDWKTKEALIKANPNWGVSVIPDKVLADQLDAINTPRKQVSFKTKHLNIWTDAEKTWIPNEKWIANMRPGISISDYAGLECYAGLDLSSSLDFTALAITFIGEGVFYNFWKYYIPEESSDKRTSKDNINIRLWQDLGYITITPGNVVDYDFIQADIIALSKTLNLQSISYDPYNSSQLVTNLIAEGLPMAKFPQGINYMSTPTKEFEKLVASNKYLHDGNKVTEWMLSNVVIITDPNENIKPHKGKSANKIDGIVASINALGGYMQAQMEQAQEGKSVYEERGIREI